MRGCMSRVEEDFAVIAEVSGGIRPSILRGGPVGRIVEQRARSLADDAVTIVDAAMLHFDCQEGAEGGVIASAQIEPFEFLESHSMEAGTCIPAIGAIAGKRCADVVRSVFSLQKRSE